MKVSTTRRRPPSRGRLDRIEKMVKEIDRKLSMFIVEEIRIPVHESDPRFTPSIDYPVGYIPQTKEDFKKYNWDVGTNTVKP